MAVKGYKRKYRRKGESVKRRNIKTRLEIVVDAGVNSQVHCWTGNSSPNIQSIRFPPNPLVHPIPNQPFVGILLPNWEFQMFGMDSGLLNIQTVGLQVHLFYVFCIINKCVGVRTIYSLISSVHSEMYNLHLSFVTFRFTLDH